MDWAELPPLFPEFPAPEHWLPLLQQHAALVAEASPTVRVSSVAPPDAVRRHYAESLETWRLLRPYIALDAQAAPTRVVDVGSGGGWPGLVIAVVAPELDVHLIEPLQKRASLLLAMAAALGMGNVTVHARRAEDAGRGDLRDSAHAATARAVAGLRELLEYVAPFVRLGGVLALPKGSRVGDELAAAGNAMRELGCETVALEHMRPAVNAESSVLILRKTVQTPAGYPRRAGLPGKRPL